jgi:hypothetical protein
VHLTGRDLPHGVGRSSCRTPDPHPTHYGSLTSGGADGRGAAEEREAVEGMVGLVAGSAWAAGVNLYAVVALLGIYGRLGFGDVPEVFTRTDVIAVALVLFAVEFVVDKVPLLDSLWDLVHTAIRPLGAVGIALLLTGDAATWEQAGGAVAAGLLATASHAAKATARAAINTSPEPLTNVGVSLGEDGLVAVVVWLAVTNPLVALVTVAVLLVGGAALTFALLATARRGWRRWRGRRHTPA